MLQALAFYLFSAILIASAIMVIAARNPVHSVLFLILAFFNAAGLFVLLGAEFLAMILVVVYVGAVAGAVPVRGDDAGHRLRRT
jgi:NADH-quinone oxidoreductase subunit J